MSSKMSYHEWVSIVCGDECNTIPKTVIGMYIVGFYYIIKNRILTGVW